MWWKAGGLVILTWAVLKLRSAINGHSKQKDQFSIFKCWDYWKQRKQFCHPRKKKVLLWLFWKSPLPWMAATPKNSKHAAIAHGSASSFINMRFLALQEHLLVYTGSVSGISTPVCFCWISQSTWCGVCASFMLTGGRTLPDSVQCLPECIKHIWTSRVSCACPVLGCTWLWYPGPAQNAF